MHAGMITKNQNDSDNVIKFVVPKTLVFFTIKKKHTKKNTIMKKGKKKCSDEK